LDSLKIFRIKALGAELLPSRLRFQYLSDIDDCMARYRESHARLPCGRFQSNHY
jgi:hypothetical protein